MKFDENGVLTLSVHGGSTKPGSSADKTPCLPCNGNPKSEELASAGEESQETCATANENHGFESDRENVGTDEEGEGEDDDDGADAEKLPCSKHRKRNLAGGHRIAMNARKKVALREGMAEGIATNKKPVEACSLSQELSCGVMDTC